LTCFLIPYFAVSGWSIYFLFKQIWLHTGLGQTAVEVSDHPLYPGREYQVHLSQAGHLDVKSIELWLVCEEEVTYRQGTDVRREVRQVFEQQILSQGPAQIDPASPYRATCTLPIPTAAMHSFQSEHNAVYWKLVVKCAPTHWPDFERRYPIVVFPGEATLRAVVTPAQTGQTNRSPRSAVASIEVVA
jgi:hypothetical protein